MFLLRATVSTVSCALALIVWFSAVPEAAPQEPAKDLPVSQEAKDLPVSLDRIREQLAKTPQITLKLDMPLQGPVARFKTSVEQRVYMLSFEDWIEEEFKLTALQRQSADWAAKCCGGYVLATGTYGGVSLDSVLKHLQKALQRRRVRKIREQIARELADLEAARKEAGISEKR